MGRFVDQDRSWTVAPDKTLSEELVEEHWGLTEHFKRELPYGGCRPVRPSGEEPAGAALLAEAKVVWADYNLLRQKVPSIGANTPPASIDAFLLEHFAVMDLHQLGTHQQNLAANTPIPIRYQAEGIQDPRSLPEGFLQYPNDDSTLKLTTGTCQLDRRSQPYITRVSKPGEFSSPRATTCRLVDHGRATVTFVPIRAPGDQACAEPDCIPFYVDVKGAGKNPLSGRPRRHAKGNGLFTLGEALREVVFQRALQRASEAEARAAARPELYPGTVRAYAVIDAGFDVIQPGGNHDAAALLLREAHTRPTTLAPAAPSDSLVNAQTALLKKVGLVSNLGGFINKNKGVLDNWQYTARRFRTVDFGTFGCTPPNTFAETEDATERCNFELMGYEDQQPDPHYDRVARAAYRAVHSYVQSDRTNSAAITTFVEDFEPKP